MCQQCEQEWNEFLKMADDAAKRSRRRSKGEALGWMEQPAPPENVRRELAARQAARHGPATGGQAKTDPPAASSSSAGPRAEPEAPLPEPSYEIETDGSKMGAGTTRDDDMLTRVPIQADGDPPRGKKGKTGKSNARQGASALASAVHDQAAAPAGVTFKTIPEPPRAAVGTRFVCPRCAMGDLTAVDKGQRTECAHCGLKTPVAADLAPAILVGPGALIFGRGPWVAVRVAALLLVAAGLVALGVAP